MRNATLKDIAKVIRSKNSGPFEVTFDIIFDDDDAYDRVKRSGALDQAKLERLYGVPTTDVVTCMFFDPARAFKLTLRRPWTQGGIGERDTFGAQQHAPLMDIEVP
ncbi:MAG: DUF4387 domain-containing protein [Janthinobacterium lividum]|jgi:hypothetical protein